MQDYKVSLFASLKLSKIILSLVLIMSLLFYSQCWILNNAIEWQVLNKNVKPIEQLT